MGPFLKDYRVWVFLIVNADSYSVRWKLCKKTKYFVFTCYSQLYRKAALFSHLRLAKQPSKLLLIWFKIFLKSMVYLSNYVFFLVSGIHKHFLKQWFAHQQNSTIEFSNYLILTTTFYHKQCGDTHIMPILILLPSRTPDLKFGCQPPGFEFLFPYDKG